MAVSKKTAPKPIPNMPAIPQTQTSSTTVNVNNTQTSSTTSSGCPSLFTDPLGWAGCQATQSTLPPALAQFVLDPVDALERIGLVILGSLIILLGLLVIGIGIATPLLGGAARVSRQTRAVSNLFGGGSSEPTGPTPEMKEERERRLRLAEGNLELGNRKLDVKETREKRLAFNAERKAIRAHKAREPNPSPKHS